MRRWSGVLREQRPHRRPDRVRVATQQQRQPQLRDPADTGIFFLGNSTSVTESELGCQLASPPPQRTLETLRSGG